MIINDVVSLELTTFVSNSVDRSVTKKNFNFAVKNDLPFYFVSASDGSNVVRVRAVLLIIDY